MEMTFTKPVTVEPKTAKLSDLLESCDPQHLGPGTLRRIQTNTVCALGLAYEHGSGKWEDINFPLVNSIRMIHGTNPFFYTMKKDWGLTKELCKGLQEKFDDTFNLKYSELTGYLYDWLTAKTSNYNHIESARHAQQESVSWLRERDL